MAFPNYDHKTGIHYGVISVDSLSSWALDDAEPIYPDEVDVTCPRCNYTSSSTLTADHDEQTCPTCRHTFRDLSLSDLEPCGWDYASGDDRYQTEHSETLCAIFVTKSPYYTHGCKCSPCAPNAVDLDSPDPNGAKAYCFGHDYFETGRAPYPVYSVETGDKVDV